MKVTKTTDRDSAPIIIYCHVAAMRYGQWIFNELYAAIDSSGLLGSVTEFHISVVGVKDIFVQAADNIIIHRNNDLVKGEFVTLALLQKRAIETPEARFLYIHTKGVTSFFNLAVRDWRRYMTFFVVGQHRRCLDALSRSEACGVDLVKEPAFHFSGNFWWARGNYINKLPAISAISDPLAPAILSTRHNAEFWIGMGQGSLKSMWDSGINVYTRHRTRYSKAKYIIAKTN